MKTLHIDDNLHQRIKRIANEMRVDLKRLAATILSKQIKEYEVKFYGKILYENDD